MAAATQKIIIHADDQTGSAIASAIRNSKKLDNKLKATGNVMRTTTRQGRAQMGQLGHQVQDIAVQLQMGMNPLMVFAQQGSQIAAVFGAGGAVVGALLATAAAIGSALLPALFKANEEFDKFVNRVKGVTLDFKDMSQGLREAIVFGAQKEVEKANKAYDDQLEALDGIVENIKHYQEMVAEGRDAGIIPGFAQAALDGYIKRLNDGRTELEVLAKKVTTAERALADYTSQVGAADTSTETLGETIKKTGEEVNSTNTAHEKLAEIIRNRLMTPMGSFMKQQAEMRILVEQGYLSVDEMNARLEQLKKELNLLPKDPFKEVKESGIAAVEDGLLNIINGTKNVKDSFKDMSKSIINDLLRLQIQRNITQPLAIALGLTPRAAGGPVSTGKPYLVGERGPEIMVPSGSGTIIPNNKIGESNGDVSVTVNINGTGNAKNDIMEALPFIVSATKNAIIDSKRRGGSFNSVMRT
jgi:hypothetical protein